MTILGTLLAWQARDLAGNDKDGHKWERLKKLPKRVDGETLYHKEIAGAPGRT